MRKTKTQATPDSSGESEQAGSNRQVYVVRYLAEAEVFSTPEIADAFVRELAKVEKHFLPEEVRKKDIDAKAGWVARMLYLQGIDLRTGERECPRKLLRIGPPERPAWWEAGRREGVVNWILGYSYVSAEEALQQALDGREAYLREEKREP